MPNGLKSLRIQRGWTHDQAAKAAGISRGQFIKIERGERQLTERTIALIAKAFDVPRGVVMGDEATNFKPPPEFIGDRDLPVFAAAEGGPGEMVVSTDPIELVPRPWYMKNVRDGYAVLIVGESMIPAFEPGDMAIVNPRLPPMRGKDVILVANEAQGGFTASLKRLLGWTASEWKLRQFNPPPKRPTDFTLSKRDWPKALRVVGKYYGG